MQDLVDRGVIGDIVDGLTEISEAIGGITKALGGLPQIIGTVVGAFATFKGKNIAGGIGNLFSNLLSGNKQQFNGNDIFNQYVNSSDRAAFLSSGEYGTKELEAYIKQLNGAQLSQDGFNKYLKDTRKAAGGASSVITGLSGAFKGLGMAIANIGISMLASWLISTVIQAFDDWIHRVEKAKERIGELKDEIKSLNEEMQSKQTLINEAIESYSELSKGVDLKTGENVSLSNEEYEKWVNLNQKLSDQFPTLNKGITENGNAILTIGTNAEDSKQKLQELLEEEEEIASYKMHNTLNELWKNLNTVYNSNNTKTNFLRGMDISAQYMQNEAVQKSLTDASMVFHSQYFEETEFIEEYVKRVNDWINSDQSEKIDLSGLLDLASDNNREKLKTELANLQIEIDRETKEFAKNIHSLDKEYARAQKANDVLWAENKNDFIQGMMVNEEYQKDLNANMQKVALEMMNAFDSSIIESVNSSGLGNFENYVETKILEPLAKVQKDFTGNTLINKLFDENISLDEWNAAYAEFIKYMQENEIEIPIDFILNSKNSRSDFVKSLEFYKSTGFDAFGFDTFAFDEEGYQKLIDYTKNFDEAQKQAWIEATEGAKSAQEAIDLYEESLRRAAAIGSPWSNQQFSEQVNVLDQLQSAYNTFTNNVNNKEAKINLDISDVEGLREKFAELEDFDFEKFEITVTADTSSVDDIQNSFDEALTAYANTKVKLDEISNETADMVRTQLEMEGATHESAQAYVEYALAVAEANDYITEAAEAGKDLSNATANEIHALTAVGGASKEATQYLAMYALAKQTADATELDSGDSRSQLMQLAATAGMAAAEIQTLNEIMMMFDQADAAEAHGGYVAATEIRKAAEARMQEFNRLVQERLDKNMQSLKFNFPDASDKAAAAGGKAGDAYANAFEERVSKMNAAISAVGTLMGKKISAAQSAKDAAIKALNEEKEATLNALKAEQKAMQERIESEKKEIQARYEAEIKAIEDTIKAKQKEIEVYQSQIDAITKANEARERQLALQKAIYDMYRAENQRTRLVYTGQPGQMRYERDEEAVRQAREDKKKAEDDIAIAKIQEQIDLIQKSIDLLEEQKETIQEELDAKIKALDEELEAQNKYYEEMIEATEKSYDAMIKETEAYWDAIIEGLENVKSKWEELAEIETIGKAWGELGPIMEELGYTVEDVLNDTPGAFEAFKAAYIDALTNANSENQHFLDGLKYATDGAATAFSEISGNADKTQEALGKVAEATEPLGTAAENVTALGNAAGGAVGGVGQLADKTGDLAEDAAKVQELANAIDAVKGSISNLQQIMGGEGVFSGLTAPLTNLLNLLRQIASIIDGSGGIGFLSIKSAIDNVNGLSLQPIIDQFTKLNDGINTVITSLNGQGSTSGGQEGVANAGNQGQGGPEGGAGGNDAEGSGSNLVKAIEEVKSSADTNIGIGGETAGGTVIGDFGALETKVGNVITKIGTADAKGPTSLIGTFEPLKSEAESQIPLVVKQFEGLEEQLKKCVKLADDLLSTISQLASGEISVSAAGAGGKISGATEATGTAHAEGTAKASGDWSVGRNERALVGELGQEIVVRKGHYFTVGDHGPELVNLQKDDVVLNHLQSKEVLSKKNHVHGPSFANGSLPAGFSSLANDSYAQLADKLKAIDIPTMGGIKTAFDQQTKQITATMQNISRTNNTNSNVNMNNTFNISGVTGEDVARQINSTLQTTFMGLSINTMQYAKAR